MLEDQLKGSHHLAVLEIPLTEVVPADLLAKLLGPLATLYFYEFWLDRAASNPGPGPFPDEMALTLENSLLISRLEIGTPNRVTLLGEKGLIVALATTLTAVIAVPHGAVDLITGVEEARKTRAETVKLEVETELERLRIHEAELDIRIKTRELHDAGRISDEARRHKENDYPEQLEELHQGILLVPENGVLKVRAL